MYNILIVDDEYYICEGLSRKIQLLNLPLTGEIRTCMSGEAALSLCQTYKPQIIFTDIRMSGINGIELIHVLSQKLHPVQFIVLSGYDEFDYVRGAFQNGAIDYLLKPILNEDLAKVLTIAFANLKRYPHVTNRLRETLFQLSAHILQELSTLGTNSHLPASLISSLEDVGIRENCTIAILAFRSPQSYESMTMHINAVYDSMDNVLCNALSEHKIGIISCSGNGLILKTFLSSAVKNCNDDRAASLTNADSIFRLSQLFQKAEEYLCLRLSRGYGHLFTEIESDSQKGFPQKLKHLTIQLIKTPSLITHSVQRATFYAEIEKLSVHDLINYFYYFNELLGVALSDNNLADCNHTVPSLFDFSDYNEITAYFYKSLTEYAQKAASHFHPTAPMEMVRDYIDIHYMEDLSLSTLADRFFMSYSYLSKLFQKTFHMSFQEYLRMIRMEHALELLKNPGLSVQQIASDVGYENAFNFSRAFKTQYGVSPSHFRARN